jgi:flagellar protein FliO/FliZ
MVLHKEAWAAEGSSVPSLFMVSLQMVAALAVVVGLILLFYYVSNRWLRSALPNGGGQRYIRLVETRFLGPKKSLFLVEVGGDYLLLSTAGDGLRLIKQVDLLEEIEVLDGSGLASLVPEGLQDKIIDLVSRLPKRQEEGRGRAQGGGRR